jgi:hypothetical protein
MPVTDAPDIDLLRTVFAFLLSLGFREIEATPWPGQGGILTYASSKVRVKVSLSRLHWEADVDLGLVNAADTLSLRSFTGLAPNEALPPPVMFSRGGEQGAVERLAQLTKQYAAEALQVMSPVSSERVGQFQR